jgi:hypothetical protein
MRRIPLLVPLVLAAGCGTFRGIPSHGGGKRFDEEQRIVASAIRQSMAEMDLQELRGRHVRVVVQSIAHEGSGNVNWPGLTNISLSGSLGWNENNYTLTQKGLTVSDTENTGVGAGANYRTNPEYYASALGTSQDLTYLQAVLEMKARHDGILLDGQPDATLYVLVDVLGTNRSRRTYMLRGTDNYHATCEMTYYAQDLASGDLIFRERQAGAVSSYSEEHTWSSPWIRTGYATVPICPQVPLLDEADWPPLQEQDLAAPEAPQAASQPADGVQPVAPTSQPAEATAAPDSLSATPDAPAVPCLSAVPAAQPVAVEDQPTTPATGPADPAASSAAVSDTPPGE